MGYHRRQMITKTFPKHQDRAAALKAFCSVYMLERRISLGSGVPFSIQDSHVDPSLFTTVSETSRSQSQQISIDVHIQDISSPFLSTMIEWTRLAGKTWQALNVHGEMGVLMSRDEIDFLDYQIIQWYNTTPNEMQLQYALACPETTSRDDVQDPLHLPAVLYIRQNHLRNLVYRPILQTTSTIKENMPYAWKAAQVAKESIRTISTLNGNTDLIRSQPIFFKHFLLTAFGNLLLLVVNEGAKFWRDARAEFYLALRLIKGLGSQSGPLLRLWQRLKGLEELQLKSFAPDVVDTEARESQTTRVDLPVSDRSSDVMGSGIPGISELPSVASAGLPTTMPTNVWDDFGGLFDSSYGGPHPFFDLRFMDYEVPGVDETE